MANIICCALPAMIACLLGFTTAADACVSSSRPRELTCNCQPAADNEAPAQVICSLRGTLETMPQLTDEGVTGLYIMTLTGGGTISTLQQDAFGDLKIVELHIDNIIIGNVEQSAFSSLGKSLQRLRLTSTRLSSLVAGAMKGLTSLLQLDVSYNELSELPGWSAG